MALRTTVQYGACIVIPVAPRAPMTAYGLMVIMIMIFGDTV